jgi:hypothetical protein
MPIDPICKMDVDPGEAITIRASEASGSGLDIRHFIDLLHSISYGGGFFILPSNLFTILLTAEVFTPPARFPISLSDNPVCFRAR